MAGREREIAGAECQLREVEQQIEREKVFVYPRLLRIRATAKLK